ncbi:alpha/beta hydrolase-fold protein [Nocardia sp. NPDC019395]|uniref:alpha/beta hydrolase n=1 Tax=Nocardia sp. NPDC019395 TaxID=3154686 RepID=UPI0033C0E4FA
MSWSGFVDSVLARHVTSTAAVGVLVVLTVVGLVALAARRQRRRLLAGLAAAVVATVATVALAAVLIEKVWRPFPEPLPLSVYAWSAAGVLAVALFVGRWFVRRRDRPRPGAAAGLLGAVVVVVLCAAGGINAVYDAYPTVRAVLGISDYRTVPFDDSLAPEPGAGESHTPAGSWVPPADLPETGAVTKVGIPGTVSRFSAREARIYLPPAYFASPRPDLPVLVLLAGQPGGTDDWLVGGRLTEIMDDYAAGHRGLAPIVVLADGTGSQLANPLCVDSHLGNVATYLTVDVPEWVRSHLQVDPDPRAWAVGGLSYGGTCSLQLATTRPEVYPTFLDMSGQAEPTLGHRNTTVREVFGGDAAAFARNNPADLLAHNRYPDSAGAFVVGLDDTEYRGAVERLAAAARAAGMDVHLTEVPGAHSFAVWSAGLEKELPWLGHRLGLDPA